MVAILTRRPTRRVWAAALLAASVLATPLAPRAHAAFGACRSDPLVTLSNGVTLRLYADIATDASQVQQVAYALHGPVGTSVVSAVIPADDPLWDKEQFVYYADGHDTKYHNQLQVTIAGSGNTKTKITSYIDGADDHGNRKTWQHGGDSTQVITTEADIKVASSGTAQTQDQHVEPQHVKPLHDTQQSH